MKAEIEQVSNGYIINLEGKSMPIVFKNTEETQLLEYVAKEFLRFPVTIERK